MEEDWNALTQNVCFITDLGEKVSVERYAVWIPEQKGKGKHRIAEVGSNLQALRTKYKVKPELVFRVRG